MVDVFDIDGNIIRMLLRLDIRDETQIDAFREAISEAGKEKGEVVIDFSHTRVMSSVILMLTYIAVEKAREIGVVIRIVASMKHHRALVASGMPEYIDLQLCG
jgi:anti-anti-sigma regulatory factor